MHNKTTSIFIFIKRNCSEFKDPNSLKTLCCSLICLLDEFSSISRVLTTLVLLLKPNRDDTETFSSHYVIKLGKTNTLSIELANELNLESLVEFLFNNDFFFLYKLLNNLVHCLELLK